MNIKSWIKKKYQKLTRGYSDEELWNLDATIAEWIVPRLKTFKEKNCGYPIGVSSKEEWDEELETMIQAFEYYLQDPFSVNAEERERQDKIIAKGFELFGKRIRNLWW